MHTTKDVINQGDFPLKLIALIQRLKLELMQLPVVQDYAGSNLTRLLYVNLDALHLPNIHRSL